ncbi:MAG: hypothetical protein CL711_02645 [Chloroflexi bacterium]|nr:hypothetical protein [Chloroflexota bacterium]
MQPKIKKLSKDISLLIAAGEVIDKPVSIIKELVENSIDANSKKIIIKIKNGGKDYISITDDGIGINPDELELAFESHATSKLNSKDDIYKVSSLGFRGEALASISSVSKIECKSRIKSLNYGNLIEIKYGKVISKSKIASNYGTQIIVKDIFHNIPARLKYLSNTRSESGRIGQFIQSVSMSYPKISFELIIDGKKKYHTKGDNSKITIFNQLYKLLSNDLISVDFRENSYQLSGYISKPNKNFGNRSRMNFTTNGRVIKNPKIFYSIENAYRYFNKNKRFPIFNLNLTIPFNEVDVNIHPQKHEVKFEKEAEVISFIYNNILKVLNSEIPSENIKINIEQNKVISQYENTEFDQTDFFENSEEISLKKVLPILRFIGQIKNTFILCEGPDGLYIIDQHAAHERILFEKFMKIKSDENFQTLGILRYVDLGILKNQIILEKIEKFKEMGWDIEESATGEILVRNLPFLGIYKTREVDLNNLFETIILDLESNTDTPSNIIAKRLACNNAVKSGDKLSEKESEKLISDLEKTEVPWDPHGRPAVVKLEFDKLSRQFGR